MKYPTEGHIGHPDHDQLGFNLYAEALAELIEQVEKPQVIGVTGVWGAGKTSLMSLCRGVLSTRPGIATVWLDAWKYDGEVNLLFPLCRALMEKADEDPASGNAGNKVARVLMSKASQWVEHSFGFDLELEAAKKAMTDAQKLLAEWCDEIETLQQCMQSLVEAILEKEGKTQLCLFIDDLDRCSPAHAIELLEEIHIHFKANQLVVVVGLSQRVVERGVSLKYGGLTGYAAEFMEKLIHLDFPVPTNINMVELAMRTLYDVLEPSAELKRAVSECVAELPLFPDKTPRRVKRLVKKAVILYTLLPKKGMKWDSCLATLLVLKECMPDAFDVLTRRPEAVSWFYDSEYRSDAAEMNNKLGRGRFVEQLRAAGFTRELAAHMKEVKIGQHVFFGDEVRERYQEYVTLL